MSMPVTAESFVVTRGWPKFWRSTGWSGVASTYWFCGECGGRLYGQRDARCDVIAVWAGTLDDTSWLRPIAHVYLGSAQALERIPECFEAMPGDLRPLADKWKELWGDG